jgi:hypothetical protein
MILVPTRAAKGDKSQWCFDKACLRGWKAVGLSVVNNVNVWPGSTMDSFSLSRGNDDILKLMVSSFLVVVAEIALTSDPKPV